MDMKRFQDLADAYGGDLARWPAADRFDARRLAAQDPAARTVLAASDALDKALQDWTVEPPSAALKARVERLLEDDGRQAVLAPRRRRGPALKGVRVWLSGAGLATAGLLGVFCGTALSSAATAEMRDQAILATATSDALGPFSGALDARPR
jgi:hypothetical protein